MKRSVPRRWDIFCQVIDNYGDLGVCWRLARQLAKEYGIHARLWIQDAPQKKADAQKITAREKLARLAPEISQTSFASFPQGKIELRDWAAPLDFGQPAEVVIEAFACDLPGEYLSAMTRIRPAPRWLNLEYLTPESWAETCHARASPHPNLPLVKYFFIPGFTPETGGLLREKNLCETQALSLEPSALQTFLAWLDSTKLAPKTVCALRALPSQFARARLVSLFHYDCAPLTSLLTVWRSSPFPLLGFIFSEEFPASPLRCGENYRLFPMPFLPQDDYDAALALCDLNFVRGEDSFLRAQWAGKPFVWQAYPQEKTARNAKLLAFLARFSPPAALDGLWRAWNGLAENADIQRSWENFHADWETSKQHARQWRNTLTRQNDLAARLVHFVGEKLE
ncbi:MAG: elongation factor P maturation arginine rhamnosyltransferase EarP [Zoogloeaceae bacterium]|jgi:uncharacterized repeat protein (TIGR03837 family)|nr:elongation factor P maturation arginine rhamnosyltransferase EarP [Zoogloeaceae bacterium]